MIIDRQVGRSSPKERVNYLLYGADGNRDRTKVDIIDGDPVLFSEIAEKNPYKTKTYNFLISFAESKEELQRKLEAHGKTIEELYEEIISFLLPAEYYPREALNILAIGHADTDNYHIHLTVENYDHLNQKYLYLPKTRAEVKFYRALEDYINAKYDLDFRVRARSTGRTGVEKIKEILEERGTYKNKTRDEVKEEITQYLMGLIQAGEIEDREELIEALLEIPDLKITRKGKSYISFEYKGQRYRLKGGIYDEERFQRFREELAGAKKDKADVERLFSEALQKRTEQVKKRRKNHDIGTVRERLDLPDRGIGKERELPVNERDRGVEEVALDRLRNPLDRYFGLDWSSAIQRELRSGFFSSLQVGNHNQRTEVLSDRGHDRLLVWKKRLGELQSSKDMPSLEVRILERKIMDRELLNEIRREELQLLKELDPELVLGKLGIPFELKNGYYLLRSPLRKDTNPSFQVFWGTERGCWIYMDFGTGWRGSSIDLWKEVKGLSYTEAVRDMRETFGINLLEDEKDFRTIKERLEREIRTVREFQRNKRRELAKREKEELRKAEKLIRHRILKVKEPSHTALLNYLKKRGIRELPDWLKEVYYLYKPNGKTYFGLGVKDKNGVWHIRNAYDGEGKVKKLNIITTPDQKPTYTLIKRGGDKVVIVEGLFDALTINQIGKGDFDIVILNSTTHTDDLIESGELKGYKTVYLALDNDLAGKEAEEKLYNYLKKIKGVKIYRLKHNSKDLNEALTNKEKIEKEDITPKTYYIGLLREGVISPVHRAVISDDERVFQKLNAIYHKEIEDERDIAEFWSANECRGEVEVYIDGELPEWIRRGLERDEWERTYQPPWSTVPQTEIERPTGIKRRKYFEIDGRLVLDREVEENPERYADCDVKEVREIAERILKQIEEARRREFEWLTREDSRSKRRGLSR